MSYETYTPEELEKQAYEDKKEGDFARGRIRAAKKISKPCTWNGMQFNSARDLARYLKMGSHNNIYGAITNKREIKGHVPRYGVIKGNDMNEKCIEFIKSFNRISFNYEYSDSFDVVRRERLIDSEADKVFLSLDDDDKKAVCQELSEKLRNRDFVGIHIVTKSMHKFVSESFKESYESEEDLIYDFCDSVGCTICHGCEVSKDGDKYKCEPLDEFMKINSGLIKGRE